MPTRSILITGCSTGIGKALAYALRDLGYKVCATARKAEDIAQLKADGISCFFLDYVDQASIQQCVEDVLKETNGELYALINNGGYGQPGAVEDIPRDILRHQFEANVIGWYDLIRQVLPTMRKHGTGRIINIGSILAFYALSFRGPYAATKHANEAMSWALRLELAGSGVHVSVIEPGPLNTEMRAYGYKMLQANIDVEKSPHAAFYRSVKSRLFTKEAVYFNTREPIAVLKPILKALESKRPRMRYFVTAFDRFITFLVGILPEWMLERLLHRASKSSKAPKPLATDGH